MRNHLDKVLILVIFAAVVGAIAGFGMLGDGPARHGGSTTDAMPATAPVDVGEFRGISLQLHNPQPDHPYERYVTEISQTGANTICFVVTAYQENAASGSLFIEARKSPTIERLKSLIDLAHRRGLKVVLMPIVLLENPRSNEWRGKIDPEGGWDAWWEDYTTYILHYAKIAQQTDVEMFVVGSELISTETQADRWRTLIRRVRDYYPGLLTYSSNWDHYTVVEWWDALDVIGMTTYYDLTGGKEPTVERMLDRWAEIKADIRDWQRTIGKPILFTEVGWPNQETCAQYPWNYYEAPDRPDPQAQANCFEAFFRTWIDEPGVAGFLVWEWVNHPGQELDERGEPIDPATDTSYTPKGKPAMRVIREYFQRPAPKRSGPASRPTTSAAAGPHPDRPDIN